MISRRWKKKLRFSEATIVLAVIAALVALGLTFFFRTYFAYNSQEYRPFDGQREKVILKDRGITR